MRKLTGGFQFCLNKRETC